ncbi:MAG: sodium/glutamate symporter [Candidatus Sulfomarinibacteraceae bacterium]
MKDTIVVSELHTLIIGLVALGVGATITHKVAGFRKLGMPISVTGGVLVALLILIIRNLFAVEIEFGTESRDVLLLIFFTTVGLSAKLSSLKAGGRALAILCGATVALLVVQNLVGIGIVLARGDHPFYGLLIGSLSFVGGPGTAIAWATEGQAMGLPMTTEVALGSATLATLAGALVAPFLTGWLIRRRGLSSDTEEANLPVTTREMSAGRDDDGFRLKYISMSLLVILAAVAVGDWLNDWARSHSFILPGFLTAM